MPSLPSLYKLVFCLLVILASAMYLFNGTGILQTLLNSFLRRIAEMDMSKRSDIRVACFIFLPTYFVWNYFYRLRQFPPGPWPLPVIGNFLQIDTTNPHRSMIAWREKYGPIFTIWMPKPVIVFASYEELHNRLENYQEGNYYIDRPLSFLYGIFSNHQPDGDGIILSKGIRWRAERSYALTCFRNLGMGKPRMESNINQHKDDLINRLADCKQDVVDVHKPLAFCFGNIIHDLVIGQHFTYESPIFWKFKYHIDRVLEGVASVQMLVVDSFPWMRHFFPAYYSYLHHGSELQNFFLEQIEEHSLRLNGMRAEQATNFIDAYLIRLNELNAGLDISAAQRLTLALDSGDLWTGGMETVVTTLTWAVLYLIHYPKVQANLQKEIDEQLQDQPFTMGDRLKLPYMCATIDELQRIVNVLPWAIPHATTKEMTIAGKQIPAGTTIMPQIGAVLHDEHLFPDPDIFKPERFIDEVKNTYTPSKYLKPFGVGKRACLGESLARMELSIVFASMIQNFNFEAADPACLPSLARLAGMASKPNHFKCRISQRRAHLVVSNTPM